MKKLLMFTVVVLTGLLFMPLTQAQDLIGTVTEAQNKDSVKEGTKAVISNENPTNITITYEAANLKIVEQKTGDIDRKTEAAWVGFIITTPGGSGETKKVKINDVEYEADKNGEYYFAITKEKLNSGQPIVYTCEFDWDYQGDTFSSDQTVTVTINPAVVKLVEKDGDNVVYDGPALAEAQKQEENKEAPKTSTDNTKNPNTADSIYLWLGILAISGIGLGCFVKKLN